MGLVAERGLKKSSRSVSAAVYGGCAAQQPIGCAFPRFRGGKSCVKREVRGGEGSSDGGQ